ncbi:hypothetical protein ACFO3O_15580 [Dokdonia ponticola]|uniref:Outer membrane lipoprotein-sorting protein n=1 Tax=Dokdonia ponticola TaxID=2041041 RepID=A0ABV9I264_9FLAO
MSKIVLLSLCYLLGISTVKSQNSLNPSNLKIEKTFELPEKYVMDFFFMADTLKVPIGKIYTTIVEIDEKISTTTKVKMNKLDVQWVDSTVVNSSNFKPIYHSSVNQQREMVLIFGKKITGFYKDKATDSNTPILEEHSLSFFDSNFYPHLIKLLPLQNGFTTTISIFDYNPKSKVGVMNATIKNTKLIVMDFKGEQRKVWKVNTTNDISDNKSVTTFYIDKLTKKTLKQITETEQGQLVMERERLD